MHFWMTLRTGLRNSSTGVPMVMITGPARGYLAGPAGEEQPFVGKRLNEQRLGVVSMKGTRPDFNVARVCSLMSLMLTVSPLAANDSTSGMPTWPAPPTTVNIGGLGGGRTSGGRTVGNIQRFSPKVSTNRQDGRMKPGTHKSPIDGHSILATGARIPRALASGPANPD